jgi:hypothetical protein
LSGGPREDVAGAGEQHRSTTPAHRYAAAFTDLDGGETINHLTNAG